MDDIVQSFLKGDFSLIEGAEVRLDIAITEASINLYLKSLLDEQLKQLEIECLSENQARVRVKVKVKGLPISRDFLVQFEGGIGSEYDGFIFLHIRNGFKIIDALALQFSETLNRKLPDGVNFIVEFRKERFAIDLSALIKEFGAEKYLPLLKEFKVSPTPDQKFRIAMFLSADTSS